MLKNFLIKYYTFRLIKFSAKLHKLLQHKTRSERKEIFRTIQKVSKLQSLFYKDEI